MADGSDLARLDQLTSHFSFSTIVCGMVDQKAAFPSVLSIRLDMLKAAVFVRAEFYKEREKINDDQLTSCMFLASCTFVVMGFSIKIFIGR